MIILIVYGGNIYSKYIIYQSNKNFPTPLKNYHYLNDNTIHIEGKNIIPLSYKENYTLTNYFINEKNELITYYFPKKDSNITSLSPYIEKYDNNGNRIHKFYLNYGEKEKSAIVFYKNIYIDIYNTIYYTYLEDGDTTPKEMKFVKQSEKWNKEEQEKYYKDIISTSDYSIEVDIWDKDIYKDNKYNKDTNYYSFVGFIKNNTFYYFYSTIPTKVLSNIKNKIITNNKNSTTNIPLFIAFKNNVRNFVYPYTHKWNDELDNDKTFSRRKIFLLYYLDKKIITCRYKSDDFTSEFYIDYGEGDLFIDLHIDNKILQLKTDYTILRDYDRDLNTPTIYKQNEIEEIENYKNILIYSNSNLNYYLFANDLKIYMIK
ncbi:MAG: hypothetical protein Q3983_03880 [Capnocytophaga sp.]|nr:hypothetical protein [Capnocytophaga sp.]